jgi:diketogulonate reductase-like aldo/keto reductase
VDGFADYIRRATERSLERCGVDHFDVLLLHNPDRTGYRSEAVWAGMAAMRDAGLTRRLGVAPGPANGFTLDVIECFERFGEQIDWAMIILSPMEPWPGELVLPAAQAHGVRVITRVVDYGGLFHDDVAPDEDFAEYDHRRFRPAGWVRAGLEKLEAMRPVADAHGLAMLQLACTWNLAQPAVACVAPTLIQERDRRSKIGQQIGRRARAIERKRAELAELGLARALAELSAEELRALRAIGDNTGSMALKGASAEHEGPPSADRWALDDQDLDAAERWRIDPRRDLSRTALARA